MWTYYIPVHRFFFYFFIFWNEIALLLYYNELIWRYDPEAVCRWDRAIIRCLFLFKITLFAICDVFRVSFCVDQDALTWHLFVSCLYHVALILSVRDWINVDSEGDVIGILVIQRNLVIRWFGMSFVSFGALEQGHLVSRLFERFRCLRRKWNGFLHLVIWWAMLSFSFSFNCSSR